jgi:hypothetical protein
VPAQSGPVRHLELPTVVPQNSLKKLRPCTHRVIARSPRAGTEVAKLIRKEWGF